MKDLTKLLTHLIKLLFTTVEGLVIVVSVIFVTITYNLVSHVYTEHYKNTTLKPFYDKVKLAENESDKINLANFISKKTVSQVDGVSSRRASSKVADCTRGSYVTASGKSGGGLWCMKGYVKYFGSGNLTQNVLDSTDTYLKNLGWQPDESNEEFKGQQDIILHSKDRGGSFIYKNSQGLRAYANFAPANASWSNCHSNSLCDYSHRTSKTYPAYIQIGVSYEQRPF